MSEGSEQDKSELPTTFKLAKARREGSVARGMDLGFLASIGGGLAFAWFAGQTLVSALFEVVGTGLSIAPTALAGSAGYGAAIALVSAPLLRPLAAICGAVFLTVLLFEFIQVGPVFSTRPLSPDFNRLNPANGLKRLFTVRLLIETAKAMFKLAVYGAIAMLFIHDAVINRPAGLTDAGSIWLAIGTLSLKMVAAVAGAAIIFAVVDQMLVRKDFTKKMRMSRREVRREHRDREGDARLKGRRKELHGQFVKASQSLKNIKSADVVIVNPTHFSVALRYDPASMASPVVVSRGSHDMALRLRRLAFAYGVKIVSDAPLARALYRKTDIYRPVPDDYYRQVADIYITLRRERRTKS